MTKSKNHLKYRPQSKCNNKEKEDSLLPRKIILILYIVAAGESVSQCILCRLSIGLHIFTHSHIDWLTNK